MIQSKLQANTWYEVQESLQVCHSWFYSSIKLTNWCSVDLQCVVPENYTSPTERIYSKTPSTPPPAWEISVKLHSCLSIFGPTETLTSRKSQFHLWWRGGGGSVSISQNCTIQNHSKHELVKCPKMLNVIIDYFHSFLAWWRPSPFSACWSHGRTGWSFQLVRRTWCFWRDVLCT